MLGAIIGDIVGSRFEFNNIKSKDFELFDKRCCFTDDTVLTIAVAEALLENKGEDTQNYLKKWGKKYPDAGYGTRFSLWLFSHDSKAYNSCGNGSAMRVSACGFFGKTEKETEEYAKKVTEVTHNHPEGMKGAIVTAMCIYYARMKKSKEFIKKYVSKYYDLNFDYEELRSTYTHGPEICQVTVPQAIYCFLISKDFEDCVRTTISIGGDCDTTAAISCAIAEAYYGIPEDIKKQALTYLPQEMIDVINRFYAEL